MNETKHVGEELSSSGAKRSVRKGKGRFDLISVHALSRLANVAASNDALTPVEMGQSINFALFELTQYVANAPGLKDRLAWASFHLMDALSIRETGSVFRRTINDIGSQNRAFGSGATGFGYAKICPVALTQLAMVYESGAEARGERNWEKGFQFSRAIDAAIRHTVQAWQGMTDENHLAQALWNVFAVMHFEEKIRTGVLSDILNDIPNSPKLSNPFQFSSEDCSKLPVFANRTIAEPFDDRRSVRSWPKTQAESKPKMSQDEVDKAESDAAGCVNPFGTLAGVIVGGGVGINWAKEGATGTTGCCVGKGEVSTEDLRKIKDALCNLLSVSERQRLIEILQLDVTFNSLTSRK